jgi:hypothetical protein
MLDRPLIKFIGSIVADSFHWKLQGVYSLQLLLNLFAAFAPAYWHSLTQTHRTKFVSSFLTCNRAYFRPAASRRHSSVTVVNPKSLVNTAMNLRVPQKPGNFLTGWMTVRFSRRTLLHGWSGWLYIHIYRSIAMLLFTVILINITYF